MIDSPIIVYGAGDNCSRFLTSSLWRNVKANILCVADADKSKQGKSIYDLPIVAPEELQKYDKQTPILITPFKCSRQITDILKKMQFSNFFYYDDILFNINILKPHIYEGGIIVYGADDCTWFLTSLFWRNVKANVLCIADADKSKQGKNIFGLPIVAPEELQKYDKQTPILITPLKGFRQITNKLKDMQFSNFFYYNNQVSKYVKFINKYLQRDNYGKNYFNFGGALLPDLDDTDLRVLVDSVFSDTFLISQFCNDNYDKSIVEVLDLYMGEGPYGYTDGNFDVTIKEGDIVIDAGAYIGDFSAYCANKGAEVYAFEPVFTTFALLEQTVELNKPRKIFPIKKGLSDKSGEISISIRDAASSICLKKNKCKSEQISLTTIDTFVAENNIKKVDFIKADIEGAEKDMLRGATNVLKTFAPKLAICTYHLADDPEVLENIILEANPKYRVVHLRHKLFACVVK